MVAGYATLIEVQTRWSINDLADAHEVMEIRAELEQYILKRAERRARKE